jgi:sulfofructose kinase
MTIDVLCVGHASYDLVFSIDHHPFADEKMSASAFIGMGGGPAANAAVTVAKLGFKAAYAGYLGLDIYGEHHYRELLDMGVHSDLIIRGRSPTPLSTVLVKPDGQRALINYKSQTKALAADAIDFSSISAKVVLFDGHEPQLSLALLDSYQDKSIISVLDAGSLHDGTLALMDKVDYLVCSEKFAIQYAGTIETALQRLADLAPTVVITLGEKGLIWKRSQEQGALSAFPVTCVDSTGAGDAFHGAFAAALCTDMSWFDILRYASAAGAWCCTKLGARTSLPNNEDIQLLFKSAKA